eukprot:g5916.t1
MTYGVNKTCDSLNLDAVLMAAHTCHRCLPEPCLNGGKCRGKQGHGFSCDCPSGFGGDLCQATVRLQTTTTNPSGGSTRVSLGSTLQGRGSLASPPLNLNGALVAVVALGMARLWTRQQA